VKYLLLIQGVCQFTIGVVDLYLDYDKFTFLWLITGVLFIIVGLYFPIIEKIEQQPKKDGE